MNVEDRFNEFAQSIGIDRNDLSGLCTLSHRKRMILGFEYEAKRDFVACPWLTYWLTETPANPEAVDGIVIMQDWWRFSEPHPTLGHNVRYLAESLLNRPYRWDRTLKNLLTPAWCEAIVQGRWIITNAVWALRPETQGVTGELGAGVHRLAFRIWSKVVRHFARKAHFKLVVAGRWGWFGRSETDLAVYLRQWAEWAHYEIGLDWNCANRIASCRRHPAAPGFSPSEFEAFLGDDLRREAA